MRITLLGAAGEVTGSSYLVETQTARVLIDFGMFQGGKAAEARNILPPVLVPDRLDAVILTHAHLDHTGRLPLLVKAGYRGAVHATPASIDVTDLILRDSARIQEGDAERARRRGRAKSEGVARIEPLYEIEDAARVKALLQPLPCGAVTPIADGIAVRLAEAGHILGSASIEMTASDKGTKRTVVFSGDIGPRGAPLLRDPEPFKHADIVFLESTYGDRDHQPLSRTLDQCCEIVQAAVARKGKILMPVFAIGRTQTILYHLAGLFRAGSVPPFPIYVDSPMAIEANKIYASHLDLYDEEAMALVKTGQLSEDLRSVEPVETADESKSLNDVKGPCLILAGAGMCNAGRILHHLRHNLSRPETAVIIVGYQGEGSLGRRLVDGEKQVRIFGDTIGVRASVHTLGGFSAHAGQTELLQWLAPMATAKPRVVLTHGEERGREPLAAMIQKRFGIDAVRPMLGDVVEL